MRRGTERKGDGAERERDREQQREQRDRGLYVGKYPPWGENQPMSFGGKKYEKGEKKKGDDVKEKERKGKEK